MNGTVALNILNVDPSRGLVALPLNLVDPSRQIVQGCAPGRAGRTNSFVATGRGGLPISPDQPLQQRTAITHWVTLEGWSGEFGMRNERLSRSQSFSYNSPPAIVEAQG